MYKLICYLFFVCFCCKSIKCKAQFIGVRMYHENDFLTLIGKNNDDNYTGGSKIEIITDFLNGLAKSKIINPLRWNPILQSVSFSFTGFTPTDIGNASILLDDRPYASYSSLNAGMAFLSPGKSQKFSYELSLGSMGTAISGDLQTYIHKNHILGVTRPIPQGWKYQIAAGGCFAANIKISYLKVLGNKLNSKFFQFAWLHELNLGQYLTRYTQGLRLYLININNNVLLEGIPEIPVMATKMNSISYPLQTQRKNNKFGFCLFFTPRISAVFHNATLTGKLLSKQSVYTISPGAVNKALLEYDICGQLNWHFIRIGFTQYGRTREYNRELSNLHSWGGIFLGCIFPINRRSSFN